jgi:hypothetical protein
MYYYYFRRREQRTRSTIRNPSKQILTFQNYLRNSDSVRMQTLLVVITSDPQEKNLAN